jgi:hypothetical protein
LFFHAFWGVQTVAEEAVALAALDTQWMALPETQRQPAGVQHIHTHVARLRRDVGALTDTLAAAAEVDAEVTSLWTALRPSLVLLSGPVVVLRAALPRTEQIDDAADGGLPPVSPNLLETDLPDAVPDATAAAATSAESAARTRLDVLLQKCMQMRTLRQQALDKLRAQVWFGVFLLGVFYKKNSGAHM